MGADAFSAPAPPRAARRVWLFDLDNTLHDANRAAYRGIERGMTEFIARELGLGEPEAKRLAHHYWQRYGATLIGLVRHHGVDAAHFLDHAHRLPGLEQRVRGHAHDLAALRRLRGPRLILTNAPRAYTARVLGALGIGRWFDRVVAIEDMAMFGELRPKPDARMLRRLAARLRVHPSRCVLVEDTLEHQKSAHGLGMGTVWMQRWLRQPGITAAPRLRRRPVYVDRRVRSLGALRRG